MKHTPGPWTYDPKVGCVNGVAADGKPSFDIYDIDEWPGDREESEANARLIAKAPEMLKLLQAVERMHPSCPTSMEIRTLLRDINK